eukprot:2787608-Prymnesium_polylepis.1
MVNEIWKVLIILSFRSHDRLLGASPQGVPPLATVAAALAPLPRDTKALGPPAPLAPPRASRHAPPSQGEGWRAGSPAAWHGWPRPSRTATARARWRAAAARPQTGPFASRSIAERRPSPGTRRGHA